MAPCGKKVKTFPELIKVFCSYSNVMSLLISFFMQYLTKNAITSMTRDNFSFDANSVVGQFFMKIPGHNNDVSFSFLYYLFT